MFHFTVQLYSSSKRSRVYGVGGPCSRRHDWKSRSSMSPPVSATKYLMKGDGSFSRASTARACALFVKAASRFKSEITVSRDDLVVNGKSIMGVMMLAAEEGSTIVVKAEGPDETEAVATLQELVDGKFGGEP